MFFLLWGVLVWLGATGVFKLAGHFFFSPENPTLMILSYLLVIPLILVLTLPLYKWKQLNDHEKLKAAIFIALPGMLLDVIVLLNFQEIFTNLSPDADQYFASWLLWAYSLIIVTGFLKAKTK
ncbi:DUF5367 domain-containing protein [Halalkalibacterium halodurans]|uniref:DUF5367 domain-containing protein n=1 Tax=Halalkalibacterium halodurans TaxID=86665 RepID=UPI002E247CBD|nr:DUF5367 domain-containing protein [Halalkalibacterium halodurans]MED4084480.1 DUF5367 domain-containing protein [Halalkalibacterium halodurans]MED4104040.1 DUF5367 domain-containing protein [Halalkalibacterium halodurans]MED4111007.1 DUF5367 domain-containing protein [Halalkalibacterium halodurans]MED4150348.1 DUF5367 domain-containing protein [Halalkalibacterium halodurans]